MLTSLGVTWVMVVVIGEMMGEIEEKREVEEMIEVVVAIGMVVKEGIEPVIVIETEEEIEMIVEKNVAKDLIEEERKDQSLSPKKEVEVLQKTCSHMCKFSMK